MGDGRLFLWWSCPQTRHVFHLDKSLKVPGISEKRDLKECRNNESNPTIA